MKAQMNALLVAEAGVLFAEFRLMCALGHHSHFRTDPNDSRRNNKM
jgi:hypothetical protein